MSVKLEDIAKRLAAAGHEDLAEKVAIAITADEDPVLFNTELLKEMKRLKRDLKAKKIQQGYKGTGRQKHRRQVFVYLENKPGVDIWLEHDRMQLGGVMNPFGKSIIIKYKSRSPKQVYDELLKLLQAWKDQTEK